MCSSFLQLAPGSRDLSQAQKRIEITLKLVLDEQFYQFCGKLQSCA